MAISSPGIGSGLDVNSIVQQLASIERKPLEGLKTAATFMQTQLSAFGKLQSLVSGLGDAAKAIAKPALWTQSTGGSSDPTVLGVTAGASALPGSYSVTVERLAKAQVLVTQNSLAAGATLGTGTLRIEIGQPNADGSAFTATKSVSLQFDTAPTLQQVRDKINEAKTGVSAAVITDPASGQQMLSLTSTETGLTQRLQISATDANGAATTTGLGALAFGYAAGGSYGLREAQPAQNAKVQINGLPVESPSNRISGAVEGVTLTLGKEGAATVNVANDAAGQRKAVQDFVTAYNALNAFLLEQTKYDESTKAGGSLQGDSAAVSLRNQMRTLLISPNGNSAVYDRLGAIGLSLQRDGSIQLDNAKLDAALQQPAEVGRLMHGALTAGVAGNGVAARFQKFAETVTGTDGMLKARTEGLQSRLKRNQSDQTRVEDRVERTTQRLLKEYQALDTRVAQLNSLSAYVGQQLTMLNRQFESK